MRILLLAFALLAAQPADFVSAVLRLTGASSFEELDESEISRFESLADHPVDLNSASRSRLLSTGLMSAYQIASLLDYRERTGGILSTSELSLIDGFSEDYARALSLFTVTKAVSPPGKRDRTRTSQVLTLKTSVRKDEGKSPEWTSGGKYGLEVGERFSVRVAGRYGWSQKEKGTGSVSAAYYGKRHLGKLVLGHFGARFGQGLAQWSGFAMSGAGSVGAMKKNGSGLSDVCSYTPQNLGIAADANFGCWTLSAAWALPKSPIANVSCNLRSASFGLTARPGAASLDWKAGAKGISCFGEIAWGGAPAGIVGLWWVPEYGRTICALGRYYSPAFNGSASGALHSGSKVSDEAGVTLGYGGRILDFTTDVCMHPSNKSLYFKGLLTASPVFEAGPLTLEPALRLGSRFSSSQTCPWRNEVRADIDLRWAGLLGHLRLDILKCRETAWLANAESGWNGGSWQAFLRGTLFKIDRWEDRIYVYERDAPGSFNVPAYYGRGWALSFFGTYKPSRAHAFWLRISTLQYPWTEGGKAARAELRLQYRLSL